MSDLSGQRLGKYLIDEKIAIGGMAEIYRAHTSFSEPVAIKVIHPTLAEEPKFIQMFLDEAKIVSFLRHPNIVQVYDFGKVEDTYYFSMEWIDGKPLSSVIHRQQELNIPFPADIALIIAIDVLKGLYYAHERRDRFDRPLGIVHRDVSPPNILLTRTGMAKITDFGIAEAEHKVIQTNPGIIRGKFSYMSPEQSRGESVDFRSDIFAVGIVLYEMLSARRLFLREQDTETLKAVRACDVPPLKNFRSDVPEAVERMVRRALSPQKARRQENAIAFAEDLWGEVKKMHAQPKHVQVAQFLKVLYPWETFVGVEEPLRVLLRRWKEGQRSRQMVGRPAWYSRVLQIAVRNRYPINVILALFGILAAEWLSR
ncbi:MAG: serine/threonine-protein kinase [Pseudomonadota bacterium]